MQFVDFLTLSGGLLFKPARTLNEIHFRYKDHLLKFGFLISLIGLSSKFMGSLLYQSGMPLNSSAFFLGHFVESYLFAYIMKFAVLGIIVLFLGMSGKKVDILEMVGLYLSTDFIWIVMLPLSLLFSALPEGLSSLYTVIYFFIIVISVILKVRVISISAKISDGKAFGFLVIPAGLLTGLGVFSFIYLILAIANY